MSLLEYLTYGKVIGRIFDTGADYKQVESAANGDKTFLETYLAWKSTMLKKYFPSDTYAFNPNTPKIALTSQTIQFLSFQFPRKLSFTEQVQAFISDYDENEKLSQLETLLELGHNNTEHLIVQIKGRSHIRHEEPFNTRFRDWRIYTLISQHWKFPLLYTIRERKMSDY